MINNNYFLIADDITTELLAKLKDQYPCKSHHKIKRMELKRISNQWGEEATDLYAWL